MTTSFFSKKNYLNFIKSFCRERKEGKKRKKKKKSNSYLTDIIQFKKGNI